MVKRIYLCLLATMLFTLGRPGESSATLLITNLTAPSHAAVGESVDFVFTYHFSHTPWSLYGYDHIHSNASLDFGDGSSTPVSFAGLSGSQTFSHTYSEAGSFTASISGWLSFTDRRYTWRRSYRCSGTWWRFCYPYYYFVPYNVTLWSGVLNDISTTIDIHNWQQVARNSMLPETSDAALPEPATLALFSIGLAGLGVAARRRARQGAAAA